MENVWQTCVARLRVGRLPRQLLPLPQTAKLRSNAEMIMLAPPFPFQVEVELLLPLPLCAIFHCMNNLTDIIRPEMVL